jgi:hypothetical protein
MVLKFGVAHDKKYNIPNIEKMNSYYFSKHEFVF